MKNGRQIMTVVYIPFANLPVLLFCYHIKACQCPDKLSPLFYLPERFSQFLSGKSQILFPVVITPYANNIPMH